jgi:uncharacterized membrane protein YfcA
VIIAVPALGLLIGAILGALGGGGAILTVPALVYVLGQSPQDATSSSLLIVGLTAVVGTVGHARAGQVRGVTGITFGLLGAVAAFAGTAVNRHIDPHLLLIGFALLMGIAATGMLLRARTDRDHHAGHGTGDAPESPVQGAVALVAEPPSDITRIADLPPDRRRARRRRIITMTKVVLAALGVGFLTGLFGVGGGFVIVPALVLVLGLTMPVAAGTSLLVIAINSAASLAARTGQAHFDWALIIPLTVTAMVGAVAGKSIAERLPTTMLNRAFAILLLAVAAYVAAGSALAL